MNPPYITVSYKSSEKKVPLALRPSLELSDFQVDSAHGDLHRLLRELFSIEEGTNFYLYEVESGRAMSKESFREPSYCQSFPSHWFMVMDTNQDQSQQITNGPSESLNTPPFSPYDLEDIDVSRSGDAKYQSFTLRGSGDAGCCLRYFCVHPNTSHQRSDTPLEQSTGRTHSGSDSYVSTVSGDSLEALKLSTIFIGHVQTGSLAEEVGLKEGFVVHMMNKASILRSSVEEIRHIAQHCGEEVTLLGLPQESDDLQFLYPEYTMGETGDFSNEEGLISVVDIPFILGNKTTGGPLAATSLSPPIGMVPFDDHSASQENSLSCDLKQSDEDLLISGTLNQISSRKGNGCEDIVGSHHDNASSNGSLQQLQNDSSLPSHSEGALNQFASTEPDGVDKEWYRRGSEDGYLDFSLGQGKRARGIRPTNSSSVEEEGTFVSPDDSTTAGPIKKKGLKSLEMLTKIGSDKDSGEHHVQGAPFKRYGSAETGTPLSIGQSGEDWTAQSFNSSHGAGSSDTSGSRGHLSGNLMRQSSGPSLEDQQMSGEDIVGSGHERMPQLHPPSTTSQQTTATSSSKRPPPKSYRTQRARLHGARSKTTISEPENDKFSTETEAPRFKVEETNVAGGGNSSYSSTPMEPLVNGTRAAAAESARGNTIPIIRTASVKEKLEQPSKDREKSRPRSAYEPPFSSYPLPTFPSANSPLPAPMGEDAPLFTTIVTGEESYREVDIGEAIERSQADHISNETTKQISRNRSLDPMSLASTKSMLSPHFNHGFSGSSQQLQHPEVICEGQLSIKQESMGTRGSDQSWRQYYAVLAGNSINFYKTRKDSVQEIPSDQSPLQVVPALIDADFKNSRRKFPFRLVTNSGQSSYMLQVDDSSSKQRWVDSIQQLNANSSATSPSHTADVDKRQAQGSPLLGRKATSSQSQGTLNKTKTTIKGKFIKIFGTKPRDELDYSSFVTFGHPLKECPVSADNKRVPLVVEFCVQKVEENGLNILGIYRISGQKLTINKMSAQMDKGNYVFENGEDDIHNVTSLLKKFFKELPDPLIPDSMYKNFLACARIADQEEQLASLKDLVFHLPTAHYHTLRFLIRHLNQVIAHSKENKMEVKNVALVFGPTLFASADGDELLRNMSATYAIVELLCKHIDYLYREDLCFEEESIAGQEESSLDPKMQKDQALATASPKTVRRIKNNTGASDNSLKRYSANFGSTPKQMNRTSSGNLAYSTSTKGFLQRTSDSSITGQVQSPSPGFSEGDFDSPTGRKKMVRHAYEDVDLEQQKEQERKGLHSNSRTINWINHHTEMNWGRDKEEPSLEITGSMWAHKNRERQNAKEKVKSSAGGIGGGGGRRPNRQRSDQRDLVSSYHGPSPHHSYRQQNSVPAQPWTGTNGLPDKIGRPRRVSYQHAMGDPADVPVRDTSSHHRLREDKFSISHSEHLLPTLHQRGGGASSSNSNRDDSWKGESYSANRQYTSRLSPRHQHQHTITSKYGSLQRDLTASATYRPRRNSESSDPSLERRGKGYHVHQHSGGGHIPDPSDLTVERGGHGYHHHQHSGGLIQDPSVERGGRGYRRQHSGGHPSDVSRERGGRGYQQQHLGGPGGRSHDLRPHRTYSNDRTYGNMIPPPQREDEDFTSPRQRQIESYL